MTELVDETTDLLRHLIRNACVNDGTPTSGQEVRNAELLRSYLDGCGLEMDTYEPEPGRQSLVARVEGSDPQAPSLMFMGHTDVVPANPDGWERDPFGAELVDGVVWGRGALDMLNLTASMAVAVRHLLDNGFRPRGDLVYFAVADEEAGGRLGARWLVENEPDAVRADYCVTELGGSRVVIDPGQGPRLPVAVAEKGAFWATIRVSGTPGHASMPFRTDNALVTAAEVVRRLMDHRPPVRLPEVWRRFVADVGLPGELAEALVDEESITAFCEETPDLALARFTHACTHLTIAPTVLRAGVKTNVIPDTANLDVDVRALPGETQDSVLATIRDALGDLADRVEVDVHTADPASQSPLDTPLWDALQRCAQRLVPGGLNIPYILPGATDARFLRRLGTTCYGYGAYSERMSFTDYWQLFHGDNERIDQESLGLATELWIAVARELLG